MKFNVSRLVYLNLELTLILVTITSIFCEKWDCNKLTVRRSMTLTQSSSGVTQPNADKQNQKNYCQFS